MFENVFKLLKLNFFLYIFDTGEGGVSTTRFLGLNLAVLVWLIYALTLFSLSIFLFELIQIQPKTMCELSLRNECFAPWVFF